MVLIIEMLMVVRKKHAALEQLIVNRIKGTSITGCTMPQNDITFIFCI